MTYQATAIPSQAEYEEREAREHRAAIFDVDHLPSHERRENAADWSRALRDPALIGERAGWLLAGNYGYGAMSAAQSIAAQRRGNRAAGIGILIAALEWRTSARMAREAYRALGRAERAAITAAITAAIVTEAILPRKDPELPVLPRKDRCRGPYTLSANLKGITTMARYTTPIGDLINVRKIPGSPCVWAAKIIPSTEGPTGEWAEEGFALPKWALAQCTPSVEGPLAR